TVRNAFISPPPVPTIIDSQKTHGATDFSIALPLTGTPGVECRTGGPTKIVFTFPTAVTFNDAAVTSGTGSVTSTAGSGTTTVTVNLTGVTNVQYITVTLLGVSDGTNTGNLSVAIG